MQDLENVLSDLLIKTEQSYVHLSTVHLELVRRIELIESEVKSEALDAVHSKAVSRAIYDEIDGLKGAMGASHRALAQAANQYRDVRARVEVLEDRMRAAENGLRDVSTHVESGSILKEDVLNMVEASVSSVVQQREGLAKVDYALISGGAEVVSRLTSPTLEEFPEGLGAFAWGLISGGQGFKSGKPPTIALHHDTHLGQCWPFRGSEGHLGVRLSHRIIVEEITIHHLRGEEAFDLSSAPRMMELWGLVQNEERFLRPDEVWESSEIFIDGDISGSDTLAAVLDGGALFYMLCYTIGEGVETLTFS